MAKRAKPGPAAAPEEPGPLWSLPTAGGDASTTQVGRSASAPRLGGESTNQAGAGACPPGHTAVLVSSSSSTARPPAAPRRRRYRPPRYNGQPGGLRCRELYGREYYVALAHVGNLARRGKRTTQQRQVQIYMPLLMIASLDRIATGRSTSRAEIMRLLLAEGLRLLGE